MLNNLQLNKRHIVFEGPIGVGKSSLCKKIATLTDAELFLEQPAENPFLDQFYNAPDRYALSTQLFFLLQRVQQIAGLRVNQSKNDLPIIADFMIEKDPIFAELTLKPEELNLYQQVYDKLSIDTTRPDLVVYLQAPVEVLKSRIKKRNLPSEQRIKNDYLARLSDAYMAFFHRYTDAPLLIVNAADFNPIQNDEHFVALMEQIDKIQAGKHFFNPML